MRTFMSNFSKISKSVKKSLCVLASASSIFSILSTAMAMKSAPKTNLSEESEAQQPIEQGEHERFKKLVEYFNEHCKKCAEFLKNHRDDIDKQILEKEREKGLDDDTINRSLSGNTEDVQREIFEEYHIANCRIGTAAVVLKARELGLNVKKVLLVETEKFNDI